MCSLWDLPRAGDVPLDVRLWTANMVHAQLLRHSMNYQARELLRRNDTAAASASS